MFTCTSLTVLNSRRGICNYTPFLGTSISFVVVSVPDHMIFEASNVII